MDLYTRYPQLTVCADSIDKALHMILHTYHSGGKLLLCGNGGSAADCGHIVGELMKGFLLKRPVPDEFSQKLKSVGLDCAYTNNSAANVNNPADITEKHCSWIAQNLQCGIPAVSLPAQAEVISAYANDVEPSLVYAQLVYGYARPDDLFVGISTSGNSENVVNAAITAKALGIHTLALTGKNSSKLSGLCDCTIQVPETETYKIQELHLPVYHYLCAEAERIIFDNAHIS